MFVGRGAGGWVEAGLVRHTGPDGLGHFVVDFEDDALGAVFAVLFLVLALDDGEGVHDVGHGVAGGREVALELGEFLRGLVAHGAFGDAGGLPLAVGGGRQVEVEEGGVQLAAEQEAALLVPAEGRAVPAAVLRERLQVPRRVGQLQNAQQAIHSPKKPQASARAKWSPCAAASAAGNRGSAS